MKCVSFKSVIVVCVLFLCLCEQVVYAQYTDSTHYYAGITASGTYNQTNANRTFLVNNVLRFGVRKKHVALNVMHKYLYGQQGTKQVNNDLTAVWDVNVYGKQKKLYGWGLLTYNRVYSLRINNQLQSGVGLAYDFFDSKRLQLNVSDGFLYDFSDVQLQDTIRDLYQTVRNSFRVQYRLTAGNISLRSAAFIQNSIFKQSDYIFKAEASLSYRVKKYLNLTVQGNYNHMSRTDKETLFVTYGLTYERYF